MVREMKGKFGERVTDVAVVGIDLDDAGSAEVLPIDRIQVDPDYQRELRHDLVNKIGREYDLVKAGPILVNERVGQNGSVGYWCVDGQHRLAGAAQAGEVEIFAHVVHGLTVAEEAELRLARNDRRSDTVYERFRVRLMMGDAKAHAMVEMARQHGTTLNQTPNMHTGINAISSAETLYDAGNGGGVWLGRVLRFLQDAFGEEHLGGRVTGSAMMKSVAWFLDRHVDVSHAELATKVGTQGDEEIDRRARTHKAVNGGALWLNYYRALVELWNRGKHEQNKIEAKTTGSMTTLGEYGAPVPPRTDSGE